jgi:hypothetical protein
VGLYPLWQAGAACNCCGFVRHCFSTESLKVILLSPIKNCQAAFSAAWQGVRDAFRQIKFKLYS